MPFYKISFVLRSNDAGWQEIFYDQADSFADFTEAEAFNDFSSMYSWRGAGVTLQAKKITEEGGLRRSKIIPLNLECTRGGTGGAKDLPGATCKMRLNFSDGGGRILNVRGVADQDIVASATGLSLPSAYALGKMNTNLKNHIAAPGNPYLGKVLQPINRLDLNETDGAFGVRCVVLMGTSELREVMLDDYVGYKMMTLWEK